MILGGILYFTSNDKEPVPATQTGNIENNSNGTVGNQNNTGTETSRPTPTPTNSVALYPAENGNFARVRTTTLTRPGYVVVYQVNSNSDVKVVGNSALLAAGTHSDLNIQLQSPVVSNQTIVAVLHVDNGDGEFMDDSSDSYLGNANAAVVSDVEVVGVMEANEDAVLQSQVETFLENNQDSSN